MHPPISLDHRLAPVTASGEQLCQIVAQLAPFLAEQARLNDQARRFARQSVAALNRRGVLAASALVAEGGFGLDSLHDLAVVISRVAHADASVAIAAYMHLALSWYYARVMRTAPVGEQADLPQRQWLRQIGKRNMIVCSTVAEPGIDPWRLNTTAVLTSAGWVINGRKVFASISPIATHFYTRLKGQTGQTHAGPMIGTVMVPRDTAGLEVIENWNGLGLRGSGSGEVIFNNCTLSSPAAFSPRTPWGIRDERAFEGRVATAAPLLGVYMGIAEAARDAALIRLKGSYHGTFQKRTDLTSIKAMIAEMEIRMTAARSALKIALMNFDTHISQRAPNTLPLRMCRALMKECICVGMIVERTAFEVVDFAMKICGGASYSDDRLLARLCRDVRAASFMRPYVPLEGWSDFVAEVTCEASSALSDSI